ncbi:MAG: hypothetical protein M5U01_04035 [Ardenticatenaceae bacterium]|nr:hypothetical protein [Ardenticatenaceae bacterium]HBY94077.1 hypothetical protein [Chloroflexota bacterium]
MELRAYGRIVWRFGWLIVLLPLLVGLLSLATYHAPAPSYGYDLKLSVSFLPMPAERMNEDPRLGAVQASEYVADDLTEILPSSRFADLVRTHLPDGARIAPGTIVAATRAEKQHRILNVTVAAATPDQATVLGDAVAEAVQSDLVALASQLWGSDVNLTLIDQGGPYPIPASLRARLDIPLRLILAAIAAIMLAFLLDYLDDSVRTRLEAEQIAGPVLAEIPRK